MNNLIKKRAKDLNAHLTKKDIQMVSKQIYRCSASCGNCKLKRDISQKAKTHNSDDGKCWQECGATGTLTLQWECKTVQPHWKTVWQFPTKQNKLLPYKSAIT